MALAGVIAMMPVKESLRAGNTKNNPNQDDEEDYYLEIDLNSSEYADLKEDNGSVKINDEDLIIINKGGNKFIALSSDCTHRDCRVAYRKSKNVLRCPCHRSVFNIDGSVVKGPAKDPLTLYETNLEGNILKVFL